MNELEALYQQFKENYESASRKARVCGVPHDDRQQLLTEAITWIDAMLIVNARMKQLVRE